MIKSTSDSIAPSDFAEKLRRLASNSEAGIDTPSLIELTNLSYADSLDLISQFYEFKPLKGDATFITGKKRSGLSEADLELLHCVQAASKSLSDILDHGLNEKTAKTLRSMASLIDQATTISPAPGVSSDEEKNFTPLGWKDSTGKTYKFQSEISWQLWRALRLAGRRLSYRELPDELPQWKDTIQENDNIDKATSNLRKYWREQGRNDLAASITLRKNTIGII